MAISHLRVAAVLLCTSFAATVHAENLRTTPLAFGVATFGGERMTYSLGLQLDARDPRVPQATVPLMRAAYGESGALTGHLMGVAVANSAAGESGFFKPVTTVAAITAGVLAVAIANSTEKDPVKTSKISTPGSEVCTPGGVGLPDVCLPEGP